jgi:hypothetical protein
MLFGMAMQKMVTWSRGLSLCGKLSHLNPQLGTAVRILSIIEQIRDIPE